MLWLGQNCHRILEAMLASAKLGAGLCPANWRGSGEEMAHVVDDLEPAVVLWQSQCEVADTIRAVRRASGTGEWVDADTEYEDLLAAAASRDPGLDDDPLAPVLYMYTAAFTGRPRAAMLGHAGLLAQGMSVAMVQGVTPEYVYLNCGPLVHIATFMTTVATFHLGGTNVFTPRVDPQEIAGLVHEERCTGAFLMPQTMTALDEIEHFRGYDLSSLRSVSSPWLKRPGGYGQTEVTGLLTLSAFGDAPMAPGRAMPMASVRIVDEDGADVPDGEVGEIVCRGPLAMVGYWRDPEESARRRRGGWHHTNDLGRREPDGTVAFVGPKTELIKDGGGERLPGRGRRCAAAARVRRRDGGHRHPGPAVGPEREGRREAARRRLRRRRNSSSTYAA